MALNDLYNRFFLVMPVISTYVKFHLQTLYYNLFSGLMMLASDIYALDIFYLC